MSYFDDAIDFEYSTVENIELKDKSVIVYFSHVFKWAEEGSVELDDVKIVFNVVGEQELQTHKFIKNRIKRIELRTGNERFFTNLPTGSEKLRNVKVFCLEVDSGESALVEVEDLSIVF